LRSRGELRELWRISGFVYREVAYQLVYMQRSGSRLPQAEDASKLAKGATSHMLMNKVLAAGFLSAMGVFTAFLGVPVGGDAAFGFAAFLATLLAYTLFLFLQPMTSFVSVKVAELLAPLPLSKSEASAVALLAFVKLFDVAIVAVAIVVPAAYAVVYRSPLAWLIALLGVAATCVFALAAAFALAHAFYTKVVRGGGGSAGAALLRTLGMLAWVFAAVLPYLLSDLIAGLAQALAGAEELLRGAGLDQLLYPLPFAHLLAFAIGHATAPPALPALAAAGYAAAAYAASKWLVRRVLEVCAGGLPPALAAGPLALKTTHPWLAVVKKDLKLASRSPTHAFTVFAPIAYGVYLAVTWASEWASALGIATFTLASAITLLSTEALAEQATGSLPLTRRLLVSSKISLAAGVYLLSTGAAAAAAAAGGKPALPLALLGLAYAPAVAASAIILSLLALSEGGAPPGDLYSRLARYLLPLIAGFLLLLIPAAVYGVLWLLKHPEPLLPMALVAAAELAVAAAVLAASK
jgi:predicted permease